MEVQLPLIIFIIFLCVLVGFLLAFWFYRKFLYQKTKLLSSGQFEKKSQDCSYEFIDYETFLTLVKKSERKNQDNLFKDFSHIYLVHGTFVGDDPFHILGILRKAFPKLSENYLNFIRKQTKFGQNLIARDLGNFIKQHIDLLEELTQNKSFIHNFTWSSGNHHYARAKAMFRLMRDIATRAKKGQKILLIGHSHAGQIFALFSLFLNNKEFRDVLVSLFAQEENIEELLYFVKDLKDYDYVFVTLGTPSRYQWQLTPNMQLLHFINHRGEGVLGGKSWGAAFTKSGDYIQQWAVAGSDMKSPIASEHRINLQLDEYLGVGTSLEQLRRNLVKRQRLHNVGHHYLVDYGDNGKIPNFLQTIFGHAVYTKMSFLNFHLILIKKFLGKL
ncbi:MAG: hypothetical protein QF441_01615 [Bacteriovoracaceae bacterium]|jgi:hypothetical protein|nr:hypothetical protein [Bacteriovoracaceae bacterium]|tara:strand:+ start:748 stop:1908 length:1161 start_codon:yes stop_codon:yes gene_type:complete